MKIEFYKHNIDASDIKRVNSVLRSIFLTTGSVVQEFEEKFQAYTGLKNVVGITSCTAALHLSLLAWDIGPGDEVITTPMTFCATSNAIIHAGAKPVFVDAEDSTGNINADLIEDKITKRTKAIMPVHLYGQMCDMKKIKKIADKYNLVIIEDAAHCIEGIRDGIRVGQLGDAACYSFYATKNITSGEGGAVGTNNTEKAEKLKVLRLHGIDKSAADRYTGLYKHWDMPVLGWKFNMDNIQAALLVGQVDRIEDLLEKKEAIAQKYEEAFSALKGVKLMKKVPNSKHARHLFTIRVEPEKRDYTLKSLQEKGIGVAVNYRSVSMLKYYKETFGFKRGVFPVSERIGDETISIPLYSKLKNSEVNYIIKAVKELC